MKVIGDIATVLNTTVDYLLNHADIHSMETCQKGGFKAEQHLDELVGEVTDLFAGGSSRRMRWSELCVLSVIPI